MLICENDENIVDLENVAFLSLSFWNFLVRPASGNIGFFYGGTNLFISGEKSFELINIGDAQIRWYSLIERSSRFTSRISIDENNLRWVCDALKQASRGRGDLYIRWERKQQQYLHRVYQNYNIHGRFVRIEVWQRSRKSAVIIPEADYNSGWVDIAEKILRLLGSHSSNGPVRPPSPLLRSYFEAAKIESWPDIPTPHL